MTSLARSFPDSRGIKRVVGGADFFSVFGGGWFGVQVFGGHF